MATESYDNKGGFPGLSQLSQTRKRFVVPKKSAPVINLNNAESIKKELTTHQPVIATCKDGKDLKKKLNEKSNCSTGSEKSNSTEKEEVKHDTKLPRFQITKTKNDEQKSKQKNKKTYKEKRRVTMLKPNCRMVTKTIVKLPTEPICETSFDPENSYLLSSNVIEDLFIQDTNSVDSKFTESSSKDSIIMTETPLQTSVTDYESNNRVKNLTKAAIETESKHESHEWFEDSITLPENVTINIDIPTMKNEANTTLSKSIPCNVSSTPENKLVKPPSTLVENQNSMPLSENIDFEYPNFDLSPEPTYVTNLNWRKEKSQENEEISKAQGVSLGKITCNVHEKNDTDYVSKEALEKLSGRETFNMTPAPVKSPCKSKQCVTASDTINEPISAETKTVEEFRNTGIVHFDDWGDDDFSLEIPDFDVMSQSNDPQKITKNPELKIEVSKETFEQKVVQSQVYGNLQETTTVPNEVSDRHKKDSQKTASKPPIEKPFVTVGNFAGESSRREMQPLLCNKVRNMLEPIPKFVQNQEQFNTSIDGYVLKEAHEKHKFPVPPNNKFKIPETDISESNAKDFKLATNKVVRKGTNILNGRNEFDVFDPKCGLTSQVYEDINQEDDIKTTVSTELPFLPQYHDFQENRKAQVTLQDLLCSQNPDSLLKIFKGQDEMLSSSSEEDFDMIPPKEQLIKNNIPKNIYMNGQTCITDFYRSKRLQCIVETPVTPTTLAAHKRIERPVEYPVLPPYSTSKKINYPVENYVPSLAFAHDNIDSTPDRNVYEPYQALSAKRARRHLLSDFIDTGKDTNHNNLFLNNKNIQQGEQRESVHSHNFVDIQNLTDCRLYQKEEEARNWNDCRSYGTERAKKLNENLYQEDYQTNHDETFTLGSPTNSISLPRNIAALLAFSGKDFGDFVKDEDSKPDECVSSRKSKWGTYVNNDLYEPKITRIRGKWIDNIVQQEKETNITSNFLQTSDFLNKSAETLNNNNFESLTLPVCEESEAVSQWLEKCRNRETENFN